MKREHTNKIDKKATKRMLKKDTKKEPIKKAPSKKEQAEIRKAKLIEALIKTSGHISKSCAAVGCSRQTFYQYRDNDPDFLQVISELDENEIDVVENALMSQIKSGNITGIIFYLKTKGKKRGYTEETININKNLDLSNMSSKDIDELLKKHDS